MAGVKEQMMSHRLACDGMVVTTTVVDEMRQIFHGEYCLRCHKKMLEEMPSSILKDNKEGLASISLAKKPRHLNTRRR